jgi:hypothetical protein
VSAPPAATHAPLPQRGTVARCLADWNGAGNASTRAVATPPLGPYPTDGGRPVSLHGTFDAYVELTVVIGAPGTNPPSRCYVSFRFLHDHRGGPAKVSFAEIDPRRGVYGDPSVNFGKDADVGDARVFAEDRDGRLHPIGAPILTAGPRRCLQAWNGAANGAVRRTTIPPRGPYALFGQAPGLLAPTGRYQVFVGVSQVMPVEGTQAQPVCYVYFRFPHGDHGRPALVSYPEVNRGAGVYGSPGITTGRNTDTGGRVYRQDRAGRLYPTDRFRPA